MRPRSHRAPRAVISALAMVGLVATGSASAVSAAQAPTSPAPASDVRSAPAVADEGPSSERIAGANRYETAAKIALTFPQESRDLVIIASGENFPDAVTAGVPGAATAAALSEAGADATDLGRAPMLLTRSDRLPQVTRDALAEMSPSQIVIIGGESAISDEVAQALAAYGAVERIAGEDRYETSALVAQNYPAGLPVLYVATGMDYPDALTVGARAGRDGVPVLLTHPDTLRQVSAQALTELAPQSVIVVGGTTAISDEVVEQISQIVPETSRIAGEDRYETAALIAGSYEFDSTAMVASGQDFPDALAGAALAGHEGIPLLLARADRVPVVTDVMLDHLSPDHVVLLGGPLALNAPVQEAIDAQLPLWAEELVVQMLSFNDYHGHISVDEGARLTPEEDPEQHAVGGAVNLATTLETLRTKAFDGHSVTVAAGDLIGGSTFISGMFQDEPAVETLDIAGLDISSVGNHEFDEGLDELLRMQHGGCHPSLGCFFEDAPYEGADFNWLAANVVYKDGHEQAGESVLPATEVREIDGVKVGFIGMTLEETPTLVSPAGVADLDFLDEVETANAHAQALQAEGVEAIVVLLHEGGYATGHYNGCEGISGPAVEIAENLSPAIDAMVTGHTHEPYVCMIDDPDGNPRSVTSANQYARVVTETRLSVSRITGDAMRDRVQAENSLVLQSVPDHPEMVAAVAKWEALAEVLAGRVVGTIAEDITGDASGDRGIETPMGNVVADAILWGTSAPEAGGADISFMNIGGVRASLIVDQISNDEEAGEVTYEEAYNVAPFGNLIVTIDMTGQQIKDTLEQQFVPERGRQYLALGISEGFTYTWDDNQEQGNKVSDLILNGEPMDMDATYKVSTLNFLADGGDMFSGFTEGTNRVGGPEDLANLVNYLEANPGLTAPPLRRTEIPVP